MIREVLRLSQAQGSDHGDGPARDPIEPQAREVEYLNKGVDRPNRIALIDPVLQALGKQRRLPAIDPLNEAPHLIPPQIAAESYSANQIIQCVFTQPGSDVDLWRFRANVRFGPQLRTYRCTAAND